MMNLRAPRKYDFKHNKRAEQIVIFKSLSATWKLSAWHQIMHFRAA